MAVIPSKWACERCGHAVYDDPKGRVCGQDRLITATEKQYELTGQRFLDVPCAGEFQRVQ